MKGSEDRITWFLDGMNKRFAIPVYQRKYDWKYENCRQLYDDLVKIAKNDRQSHFFGSIVSEVVPIGGKIVYHVIDGQQRLTTITLMLLAIKNLIANEKVNVEENRLDEQIAQRFLIAPYAEENDRIKLIPVKSDRDALYRLFGAEEDYDRSSNLTINYQFFYDTIMREEVPVIDLYHAIDKLEIISITLDKEDNAQLIFESLNSTGLALNEGDKIRNYVLMSLPAKDQSHYFDTYWAKIEKCTENHVSAFIRDYLSIKQQITPNINNVYKAFKSYAETVSLPIDTLLSDLLRYARFYEKLITCKSEFGNQKLDDCLYRFKRLDITVTRPFFLEILRLHQDEKITTDDLLQIFLITENYLFRRNICEVPTNALNKIFLNLNREILKFDNTPDHYVDKFIYALLSKKESGRYPDDDEFQSALSAKQVYKMTGKYKSYLFERFENYGTVETKDVFTHLDNNTYSIEHIMPQHLTPAWNETLGVNAEEIHSEWLHRLANLTLTGYNPNLGNSSFEEKRDAKEFGYKHSGIRMNQRIAAKETWGLAELEERNEEMIKYAVTIWKYPETNFVPAKKEFDSCTLDDDDYDLTGRDIIKYAYKNTEQNVSSWADMFEHILKYLHQKDKSVLTALAYSDKNASELSSCVRANESKLRSALKIDENIYVEKNTSTARKISILRKIFALYGIDPMDLVFYLKDNQSSADDIDAFYIRYWTYAMDFIHEKHGKGAFKNVCPSKSASKHGYFGISGCSVYCYFAQSRASVGIAINTKEKEKNKAVFDEIKKYKTEIEETIGGTVAWDRGDTYKGAYIWKELTGVNLFNESNWKQVAEFHANWSKKLFDAIVPYLKKIFG